MNFSVLKAKIPATRSAATRSTAQRLLRALALTTFLGAGLLGAAPAAFAQALIAQVNNHAITSFDVAQRIRIAALTERRRLSSKAALDELIDDQAKVIEAGRVGYRINDDAVEAEFVKLAKSNGQSTRQFEDTLRRAGLQPNALRDKMRANLAWNVLLRDRAKLGSQITREEVDSAMNTGKQKGRATIDYTLVPVVFIVPPGTSPGARMAAANAVRARFTSCKTGFDALRSMPDVFIRPTTVRSSDDLTDKLAQLFAKTPLDRMTAPAVGEQGIEAIAVCGKNERRGSGISKSSVADELSEKKLNAGSSAYLASLRKKVTIKYHR